MTKFNPTTVSFTAEDIRQGVRKMRYFILPSTDKVNYTWENSETLEEAIEIAKLYHAELVADGVKNLETNVFPSKDGEYGPEPDCSVDSLYRIR